jgi:predicted dehydrogenase
MTNQVGVAVIGAGYWGTKLVREYKSAQQKGNIGLLKVCDSSLAALIAHREPLSLFDDMLTTKVDGLIADPEILAVHIATPNRTHYTIAKAALEAGKDVLVEKPMTLHSSEAYELVDLADSLGCVLHVGHIFRYNSAVRIACQLLKSGTIGKVFYVRIQWTDSSYFPDRDIVFDLGPHPVDVLNQLLNAWPTQVSGFARAYRNGEENPEVAYGIAEFADGAFAHLELSWLQPGKVREATVVGSEGKLVIDCLGQRVSKTTGDKTEMIPVTANNTIEAEIEDFIDCVAKRDTSTKSALIGAHTVGVLEKIRASIWERPFPIIRPPGDKIVDVIAFDESEKRDRLRGKSESHGRFVSEE